MIKNRDHIEGSIQQINIQLDRNMKDISRLMLRRKDLVTVKRQKLQRQFKGQLDALSRGDRQVTMELREADRELNALLTNVQQNPRLRNTLNNMWSQSISSISKAQNGRTMQFWNENKKLQGDIDVTIKKLKTLDNSIQNLVGGLFDIGRSIDDTDEQIREILSRRLENNIQKAEPYSLEKLRLQESLQLKHQEREKVKEQKMDVVKRIISLLDRLKGHRESRIRSLFQIQDTDMPVYQQFLEGLEKIIKTKQNLGNLDGDQNRLLFALESAQQKSDEMANHFLRNISQESALYDDLSKCYSNRLRVISLQRALIGEIIPESVARNLTEAIRKCKEFKKVLDVSSREKALVKQGLQKTKETADIFDQVLRSIESQKSRRQKLMQELLGLEQENNLLMIKEQKKVSLSSQLQSLSLKQKQLQKRLSQLATKADLQGYKKVSQGLQDLQEDKTSIQSQLSRIDQSLTTGSSNLEDFAVNMHTEYNDILKEMVPHSWMKKLDLRRPQSVLQLNTYLQKTLQRLNI